MGNRILIIVSYNGDRHVVGYNSYQYLRLQHQQLTKLNHNLDKILIVVNEDGNGRYDKEYEEALKLFPHILRRLNSDLFSYGGWRDGYLANPDYEWYFFIEDDYTFFLDDFDQKWIDLWKPGMSYLAHKIGREHGYPLHASLSNGLTRGEILEHVKWERLVGSSEYDAMLQLSWSGLFESDGLADILEHYAAQFYAHNTIFNLGDQNQPVLFGPTRPVLVGPTQLIDPTPIGKELSPDRHKQRLLEDYDYRVRMHEA